MQVRLLFLCTFKQDVDSVLLKFTNICCSFTNWKYFSLEISIYYYLLRNPTFCANLRQMLKSSDQPQYETFWKIVYLAYILPGLVFKIYQVKLGV